MSRFGERGDDIFRIAPEGVADHLLFLGEAGGAVAARGRERGRQFFDSVPPPVRAPGNPASSGLRTPPRRDPASKPKSSGRTLQAGAEFRQTLPRAQNRHTALELRRAARRSRAWTPPRAGRSPRRRTRTPRAACRRCARSRCAPGRWHASPSRSRAVASTRSPRGERGPRRIEAAAHVATSVAKRPPVATERTRLSAAASRPPPA